MEEEAGTWQRGSKKVFSTEAVPEPCPQVSKGLREVTPRLQHRIQRDAVGSKTMARRRKALSAGLKWGWSAKFGLVVRLNIVH